MKLVKTVVVKKITFFIVLFFSSAMVSASNMNCGTHIIEDSEQQGQSREEIIEKCGSPQKEVYGELFYEKNGVTYQLRFNGNDELETITEVQR
jgi:hypothetical protein